MRKVLGAQSVWIRRWRWVLAGLVGVAVVVGSGVILSFDLAHQAQDLITSVNAIPDTQLTAKDRADLLRNALQYETDNFAKLWTGIIGILTGVAAVVAGAAADHRMVPPGERGCDAPRPADGWPSGKAERSEPGLSLAADYGRPSARVPREQPAPGEIAVIGCFREGQSDYSAEVSPSGVGTWVRISATSGLLQLAVHHTLLRTRRTFCRSA
jgi:hypothetical protein